MDESHIRILRRVGIVLIVVGCIDIAVMVYCIANRTSYSSSFNVFAVIAGALLMRGNLAVASFVRWTSVFFLAGFIAGAMAMPFMQPLDLTLAQVRLEPASLAAPLVLAALLCGLWFWMARELGREPVLAARTAAGRRQMDMRIPVALGVTLVVLCGGLLQFMNRGESAEHARALAAEQVGPDFRFQIRAMTVNKTVHGTQVSALVAAWNDREIRDVAVEWREAADTGKP